MRAPSLLPAGCLVLFLVPAIAADPSLYPIPPQFIKCGVIIKPAPGPLLPQEPVAQTVIYPPKAIKAHEQGHVVVAYHVQPDGSVQDVQLAVPSGFSDLDEAAIKSVQAWRFAPRDFNIVEAKLQQVNFTIAAGTLPTAAPGDLCYPPVPHVFSKVARPIPVGPQTLDYPETARAAGEEGKVTVGYTVEPDGSVANPSVLKSSGFDDLDQAALESVKTWRYQPRDQPADTSIILNFKLTDDDPPASGQ